MIDPEHDLPIQQQAEVLGISRSAVYYLPRPISAEDLWLMRRIDELHLNSSVRLKSELQPEPSHNTCLNG